MGRFRTARRRKRSLEVRRQDEYRLKEARSVAGPFGRVAQQLLRSVLEAKNKTRRFKWVHWTGNHTDPKGTNCRGSLSRALICSGGI